MIKFSDDKLLACGFVKMLMNVFLRTRTILLAYWEPP